MRVLVDKDVCVGSGQCEATCPAVFEVVDGKSRVKADPVPQEEEKRARDAVDGCPTSAI
jgi:ferredoxin